MVPLPTMERALEDCARKRSDFGSCTLVYSSWQRLFVKAVYLWTLEHEFTTAGLSKDLPINVKFVRPIQFRFVY
jgi:hypothetical protein